MSALNETCSPMFTGSDSISVARQLRNWLSGEVLSGRIPGMECIYTNDTEALNRCVSTGSSSACYLVLGLFTLENEALGFALAMKSTSTSSINLDGSIHLLFGGRVRTAEAGSGSNAYTRPYMDAAAGNATSMKPSKVTSGSSTYYCLGAWYAVTPKGGVLIGLYSDDGVFCTCPLYFGRTTNQFLHEELMVACSLNAGKWIDVTGTYGSYVSVSSSAAKGVAMIAGEEEIIPAPGSRTQYTFLMQGAHTFSSTSKSVPYQAAFSPLYGTLTGEWCNIFQLDDFYTGTFLSVTQPPVLEDIVVDGDLFVPVMVGRSTGNAVGASCVAVQIENGVRTV